MNFKSLFILSGFLFFLCSAQAAQDDRLLTNNDNNDGDPGEVIDDINPDLCFKGYADERELTSTRVDDCKKALSPSKGQNDSGPLISDPQGMETSQEASSRAARVYYDDCYCRQKGKKGKLPLIVCNKLKNIANQDYIYDCSRVSGRGNCQGFHETIRDSLSVNCNNGNKEKDYCNDIITGFLTSPQCKSEGKCFNQSRLSKSSCQFNSLNVASCTGGSAGAFCNGLVQGEGTIADTPENPDNDKPQCNNPDYDGFQRVFDITGGNDGELAQQDGCKEGENLRIAVNPTSGNQNEGENSGTVGNNTNNEVVGPFEQENSNSPVSPISPIGGSTPGNPPGNAPIDGVYSPVGGSVSRSRARVPGARVDEPGPVSTDGGGVGTLPPSELMNFSTRGTPGGNPGNGNSPGGGGPRGPGIMGGLGSMGAANTPGGKKSSSSRRRRRRRGGLPESSPRYMGASPTTRSGRPRFPSVMTRKVQEKMEENKKRGLSRQNINTLLQRGLRQRGSSQLGPLSFTPVFYFPDIEKVYEELSNQNQFLNAKGREL